MVRVFIGLLLTLPVAAQVGNLIPSSSMNISAVAAPAAYSASEIAVRDLSHSAPRGQELYRWSLGVLVAANAVDIATSWKGAEINPFLAKPGTQFNVTSVALKMGYLSGSLLIQHIGLRRQPGLYKKLAWMNFITSGVLLGVAGHNTTVR